MTLYLQITSAICTAQFIIWTIEAVVRWYNARRIQKLLDEQEKHQNNLGDE